MKINWKWPRKDNNRKAPWYTYLRAIVLLPVTVALIGTLVLSYLCILLLGGRRQAEEFARRVTDRG